MADTSVLEILDRVSTRLDAIIKSDDTRVNGVVLADLEDIKNDLGDAKKRMRMLAEEIRREISR